MLQTTPGRNHGYSMHTLPRNVVAGSLQSFAVEYVAGDYGVDNSGSIKLVWRYASDMGRPQFDDPQAANYVRMETDGHCKLSPRYDPKNNTRPWGPTIYVKITAGFLRPGERVRFLFGSPEHGCPGFHMQTFCECGFRFRLLVDDVATCTYNEVVVAPAIDIVPGIATHYRLHLPSRVKPCEEFKLWIVAHDRWANPGAFRTALALSSDVPVAGLPARVGPDDSSDGVVCLSGLSCAQQTTVRITARTATAKAAQTHTLHGIGDIDAGTGIVEDAHARIEFVSNPLVVSNTHEHAAFWGDMHGQSGETIGTGTIEEYFSFARDKACVDFASHQGNDFQITGEFWERLQSTTLAYCREGAFVTFPGYEWSGNTAVGGDRNVFFRSEGRAIRRSSHALCPDLLDANSDCSTVEELFAALKDEDCMVIPHVGGRYTDLSRHDEVLEKSVELHSAWGTFEWMLTDALVHGYHVGVVCNSDGHKGRPGASHPGRGHFGSYGGLTCVHTTALTRDGVWEAYQSRRHYGTTGARIYLDVQAGLLKGGTVADQVTMGAVLSEDYDEMNLKVQVGGTGPVLAVEIYNGLELLERIVPSPVTPEDRRILVWWAGATERGRDRAHDWSGRCVLRENAFESVVPVNFHNPEQPLRHTPLQDEVSELSWRSITTGGVAGFVATLRAARTGFLTLETADVCADMTVAEINADGSVWSAGGIGLSLRVARLATVNRRTDLIVERTVPIKLDAGAAVYVKVIQEDGEMAWSSPIYVAG